MADEKDKPKVDDAKTAGPKTKDSKREGDPTPEAHQAAADQYLQDRRAGVFGDNTSSSGGANNPGQHGRDGGTINGVDNNPAPSDAAVKGEAADDMQKSDKELQHPAEEENSKDAIKKL